MDDFEKAVALAGKRAAWQRDFDKLAAASSKLAKLETAIAQEEAKFEEIRKAFLQRVETLDADRATARTARDAGQAAKDNLLDPRNVPGGTVGVKYREAVAAAEAADVAVQDAERELREIVRRIKSEEEWIVQLVGQPEKDLVNYLPLKPRESSRESPKLEEHRLALARHQRRKGEAETKLADAQKAAAAARKAVEALVPEVLKA
jgi:hypothetical protein